MTYRETMNRINEARQQIVALRSEMRQLQANVEPEPVADYSFGASHGSITLRELFGTKDTLFVVHNMGKSCPDCTQWADGFNGVLDHLLDSAAFVVSSPDSPATQAEFARSRGWRFPMISTEGTSFAQDMGYIRDGNWPGVSVFRLNGTNVVRVSDTEFGPGDDFNVVYAFLDLTPEGGADWSPKYHYPD